MTKRWLDDALRVESVAELPADGMLPSEQLAAMWSRQSFYRVFSLVGSGSDRETDLFAGLR